MTEAQLLSEFLDHGNNYYPLDHQRFLRWALQAHQNGSPYPYHLFETRLGPRAAHYYSIAYRFVALTADALEQPH